MDRARAAGVAHVVVIGESLPGSERAAVLAGARDGLSATAGVHPHEAKSWSVAVERRLRALLAEPQVVAVGETGLDYHYGHSPRAAQRAAFEAQLALAAELGKPVVVHAREADADMAAILKAWDDQASAIVLHSFGSGLTVFEAGMDIGAYFSFSGMITFKNWTQADRPRSTFVTGCPPDRLLVETDAPYLAPVPHRGRRNEPAFVQAVTVRLAAIRAEPVAAVAAQTTANARRVFGPRLNAIL